jgi:hypothetical protein
MLMAIWMPGRWIALGFVLFAAAWLWSMATSIALLRTARREQTSAPPPAEPKSRS